MTPDILTMVNAALARYGAGLNADRMIVKNGKPAGVVVSAHKGRLRFARDGISGLLFTGPLRAATVAAFVEKFWYWTPVREKEKERE